MKIAYIVFGIGWVLVIGPAQAGPPSGWRRSPLDCFGIRVSWSERSRDSQAGIYRLRRLIRRVQAQRCTLGHSSAAPS